MRNFRIRETLRDEIGRIMQIIRETGDPEPRMK